MLLASELFQFHSERMCELMVDDARTVSGMSLSYVAVSPDVTFQMRFSHPEYRIQTHTTR